MANRLDFPRPLPVEQRGSTTWSAALDGVEVRLSNLDKVYWQQERYTKGDLLTAYYNLAPWILPHLAGRPLTMRRMPDGMDGPEFYQKEAPDHTPEWMPRARVTGRGSGDGGTTFLLAQNQASLLYVVNLGCIEFHPWHSRHQSIAYPDYAFFDLDPFPPITFEQVRRTALMVRVALEQLGLRGYPKTSGATGMQVFVPLDGTHTYEEARAFVERVCRLINATWPQGTTMEWEIARRSGKVFLDYGMNSEGKNIASVYSVRPFPGASLSTPLRWEEVEQEIEPGDFTIATIWERLDREGDLFEPVLAGGTPQGQSLRPAMEALGMPVTQPAGEPGPKPKPVPATDGEPLREYKRKRRFDVTPEPEGMVEESEDERPTYMVHKHHARRLHYDLRLERDGVLVSYAVPKGLPLEPGIRHLAVHVEDHPMEYGTFEGSIPKGEYGGGEVRIFDRGTYEILEWTDKKVSIRLDGERLQGEYHLVNTRERDWIVFRAKDSGRLAVAPPPIAEPMLATPGAQAFDGKDWLFDVKWDGVRTLAAIESSGHRLFSRRIRDVTAQYPDLNDLATHLAALNGLVDGEIVALDENGRPSFERLQQRSATAKPSQALLESHPVQYVAFDLLWLDGESLMEAPIEDRLALLQRLLVPTDRIQVSRPVERKGVAFFNQAKRLGLEGIIAKRKGSPYRPAKRSKDWLKIKAVKRQDCVIVGWTPGKGSRGTTMGALVLAVYRGETLTYSGHVGTGFTEKTLADLLARLEPMEIDEPPVPPPPRNEADLRGVRWVRPELVCEVEYLEFTSQGRLRGVSYKGLRPDKGPEDAIAEG